MSVCVVVGVCMWQSAFVHACVYVSRLEDNFRCLSSAFSLRCLSLALNSPNSIGLLASEP